MNNLDKIKCIVLDMDGTIYLGNKLFECTIPFLNLLKTKGISYYFFTNNSSKNANNYVEKLKNMGIEINKNQMMISNHVLVEWLHKNEADKTAFVVGTTELKEELTELGIKISESGGDYVILGFDTSLNYQKLCIACDMVREGKSIYGVNPDYNCPTETGFIPDCGSIAKLIEASTGIMCDFFGKPSIHTHDYIVKQTGFKAEEIAIVGDRIYTDVATSQYSDMLGVLVLSGETKKEDIAKFEITPDFVFDDIQELGKNL